MDSSSDKPFLGAIKGKVIAAFLLTCLAITLAFGITYYSFRGLLEKVDQLSTPNSKLQILHNFFQRVTQLDQLQRAEAIKNPRKPYMGILQETKTLLLTIDTLKAMDWKDSRQPERLAAMEGVLKDRDKLFLSYLKLKSDFIYNRNFTQKLDSLSGIISKSQIKGDTSVKTTTQKTVTTTYKPEAETKADNRSFLGRLFGKKKEASPIDSRVEVQEEISVKIDTLAVAQQESAIKEVGHIVKSMEQGQRLESKNMISRELQLINTNNALISQLLKILHEVEEEELAIMHHNSENAAQLVSASIKRIGLIMLVFLLIAALLVFLILTDITKGNYYRKQLIEAKEEAEELSQIKQRFLSNMSHEIRTPLQTILGFTEQLKDDSKTSSGALKAIQSSSEHLLHIVNEVLDYSRIESGKFTLVQEPFDLLQVVHEVATGIEIQAAKKQLRFVLETPEHNEFRVRGDAFRLKQILYNLLGNAIKFTSEGSVTLHVDITDINNKVNCTIKVTDTGIGIRKEDLGRVFQQFEQGSSSTSHLHGGAGLGLSIVKALVELQQGSIRLESEFGKGSTFIVDLSFDKDTRASVEEVKIISENKPKTFTGKIMLVDDDPLIVQLCSLILSKNNIPHITFQESEKALHYEMDKDISLILLDIRMPNISGVDLCKALRKKTQPSTRIVALTAHVLPQEKQGLLDEGFDEILTKPFREQQLLELIGVSSPIENEQTAMPLDLDFTVLKQMTVGDEALFQTIIRQFKEETERDISKLNGNLTSMTPLEVRDTIHKLSGRTAQMGIKTLADALRAIEQQLNDNVSVEVLVPEIMNAKKEFGNVLDHVSKNVLK